MIAGLLAYLARAISGAAISYRDGVPAPGRRVYFANHCSHLDFLVIWAALPPELRARTRPVAAADYWLRGPLRRMLAERVFRAVLIDRGAGGRAAVEQLAAALGAGDSLILFPEGTRGPGPAVAPFKAGLFHLAEGHPGLELVPVHLENLNRVLPKGEAVPVPLMSRVTFGSATALEPGEHKADFLERGRAAVEALAADAQAPAAEELQPA